MIERPGSASPPPLGQKSVPDILGERRQLTALFYDIVGSTALLSTVDPEDFGIAQRRVHTEVVAVLNEYGGYLDRVIGDGGCGYFGYPMPAEDAAEAAVSAALDIVERCRSLEPSKESYSCKYASAWRLASPL
jgi:class 3 adenylate cyclase